MKNLKKTLDRSANTALIGLSIPAGVLATIMALHHGIRGFEAMQAYLLAEFGNAASELWSTLQVFCLITAALIFWYHASRTDGRGRPKLRRLARGAWIALAVGLGIPALATPALFLMGLGVRNFTVFFFQYFLQSTGSVFLSTALTLAMLLSFPAGAIAAARHWRKNG